MPKSTLPEKLILSDDVQIGPDVRFRAAGGVRIGARTILDPGVQVITSSPRVPIGNRRISEVDMKTIGICLGADSLVGTNAILMQGVSPAEGVIVEPGTIVRNYIDPYKIAMPSALCRTLQRNRAC